ncbi:Transmembrane domain-containing protein [Spironucleus salmonicida]|uniref:Transmembrane domain-containing protein n=1 Tax=Spironucleus salmonicida TaxID=348837 RepID=V6LFI6_9EUKA|nr:Transmembrane domain-containing protein [Spironucleus salmonicida]KAH0571153.1 Transmembrane domain-containing protein [Spironucleus salmonicida]|eukprot:EST43257.1 Transmembrane domain-containing protein [Spironucleus salmonicida]
MELPSLVYLYLALLAKHLAADGLFQFLCQCGDKSTPCKKGIWLHSLQVTYLQLLIVPPFTLYFGYRPSYATAAIAGSFAVEFGSHFLIDLAKSHWRSRNSSRMQIRACRVSVFVIDQALHCASLTACVAVVWASFLPLQT